MVISNSNSRSNSKVPMLDIWFRYHRLDEAGVQLPHIGYTHLPSVYPCSGGYEGYVLSLEGMIQTRIHVAHETTRILLTSRIFHTPGDTPQFEGGYAIE